MFSKRHYESCLCQREKLKDVFGVFEQEELKDQMNSELFEEFLVNPRKYSNF